MTYTIGLDLGPPGEPTGLAIVERPVVTARMPAPTVSVRHVERFAPGMPLPEIVQAVAGRIASLRPVPLVVDQTAVGPSLVRELRSRLQNRSIHAVTITAGGSVEYQGGILHLPKTELVTSLQWLLQSRRLKIAPELPQAQLLLAELANFRMRRVSLNPQDVAWREGMHDDLVFAVALAAWFAERNSEPGFVPYGIDVDGPTSSPIGVYR